MVAKTVIIAAYDDSGHYAGNAGRRTSRRFTNPSPDGSPTRSASERCATTYRRLRIRL